MFRHALGSEAKLAHTSPTAPTCAPVLAASCRNLGDLVRAEGDPGAAPARYAEAVRLLERLRALKELPAAGTKSLRDAYRGRAEACTELGRHAEALRDWDRALDLADGPERLGLRLERAATLATLGDYRRAAAEAGVLAGKRTLPGKALYALGRVYALSAEAVGHDGNLATTEQARLAGEYAGPAVQLLNEARVTDFFGPAANRERLRTDPALQVLRPRKDFQQLLEQLN